MAIEDVLALTAFENDLKKLKKKHRRLDPLWKAVDAIISADNNLLTTKYRDHALTGPWKGFRELHIEGDWLLVYQIDGELLMLVLTRTGSHDEIFSSQIDIKYYRARHGHLM